MKELGIPNASKSSHKLSPIPWDYYDRIIELNGVKDMDSGIVTFRPVQYAAHPVEDLRWKAPQLITEYSEPIQGHLDEKPICIQVLAQT